MKRSRESNHLTVKTNAGRPKKLNGYFIRKILRMVDANPAISSTEISDDLKKFYKKEISARTIRRYLLNSGLKSYRARKKPLLSYIQKVKRKQWALEFSEKPKEFWRNILFTDETRISIFGSNRPPMVRRPANWSLDEKYLILTVKYPTSIMMWGCFAFGGVGKIKFIQNSLDSSGYKSIFENEVIESGQKLFNGPFVYQDDNAPCHRSRLINDHIASNEAFSHIW